MAKKHSLATKKDLRAGKRVFIIKHNGYGYAQRYEAKSFIIKAKRDLYGYMICVGLDEDDVHPMQGSFFFPSDDGVPGHNYDQRPVQVFLNKRSAQFWADKWSSMQIKGVNFLKKSPHGN